MELSKYTILLGISLLTASTIGDIIVRPGHEKLSKRLEDSRKSPTVRSPRVNYPNSIIVEPGYEHGAKVENTSGKVACQAGCEQKSPMVANPQAEPSNKSIVQPGYAQHPANAQARFAQGVRLENPQVNPTNNIPVPPGYHQQSPSFEIPQSNPPSHIVVQSAYHPQSRMAAISQSNPPSSIVIQPGYHQQSPTFEIPQSNPPSHIVVPSAYHPQSRMTEIAQSNPSNNIIIKPGYQFQRLLVGIPPSNSPSNIVVRPGYQAQSPTLEIPQTNPPSKIVQPSYHPQSRPLEIAQSNPPSSIVVQPGYQAQTPTVEIPQSNPAGKIIPQAGEHPQSRMVEIPQTNSPSNIAVQPNYQSQNPTFAVPQPNPARNIVVQPVYLPQSRTLDIPQFNPTNNIAYQPGYQAQNPTFTITQPNPARNIVVQPVYHPQSRTLEIPQFNPTNNDVLQPVYDQPPMSEIPFFPAPRTIVLHPNHKIRPNPLKIVAPEFTPAKDNIVVQPGYGRVKCFMEFVPHGTYVTDLSRQSSLNDEIQRNQDLQRALTNQLYSLGNQGQRAAAFMDRSKHVPFYAGSSKHVITPFGLRGFKKKKYGWGKVPLIFRSATNDPNCAERVQYVRSLDSRSGSDTGHEEHAVAAKPSIEQSNENGIVDLRVPEAVPILDNVKVKHLGPRQSDIPNAYTLDSLRERVNSQQHENPELSNPFVSAGLGSSLRNAAEVAEKKISDFVSPFVGSAKFWDPRGNAFYDNGIERLGDSSQYTEASGNFAEYPNGDGAYNSGRNEPQSNDQGPQGIFDAAISGGNSYDSDLDRSAAIRGIIDQYARRPFFTG